MSVHFVQSSVMLCKFDMVNFCCCWLHCCQFSVKMCWSDRIQVCTHSTIIINVHSFKFDSTIVWNGCFPMEEKKNEICRLYEYKRLELHECDESINRSRQFFQSFFLCVFLSFIFSESVVWNWKCNNLPHLYESIVPFEMILILIFEIFLLFSSITNSYVNSGDTVTVGSHSLSLSRSLLGVCVCFDIHF